MLNFKAYMESGGMVDAAWTGSNTESPKSSLVTGRLDVKTPPAHGMDFLLPQVTVTAKVQKIDIKANPIRIILNNGTELFLTWDQYKRIPGNIAEGKTVVVVFQRSPDDKSKNTSKISSITCTT